ncbi:MAG: LPS assembly protein LptD [Thermodesulfobacteriota bacterium]|nr:LPS assembly protein LptD [Thermodesulfobacteriota bacterium]
MNKRFLFITVILLLFFFQVDFALAVERNIQKGPVNIEADSITYDRDTDTYGAKGNVVITFTGGFLKADYVDLNKTTGDAEASGNVYIKSDNDILEGDSVKFNITTKTGVVYEGKLFFARNHFYINGKEIEKTGEATYHLKDATATTCDGDWPAWRFTGKELNVTIDGYGTIKHGTFQVKNFPFLYMPYMIFPAKTTRQSGFLPPRISHSDKHGWDIELPLYWAISKSADATFYQRYMDKRGFKEGVEFRYFISKDSSGIFYADYLKDEKTGTMADEEGLSRNWKEKQERWSYYLNHETTFSPGFYFRTDIKRVSDNWYFRDFSDYNYYLDNYSEEGARRFSKVSFLGDNSLASLDSTARLVKDWSLFNLTALVQYTDNFASYNNDSTLQKYPEITFTGVKQPVFDTPLNFELDSSFNNYQRTKGDHGQLYDVHPTFSLPLNFGDYLEFTPSIGLRETFWNASELQGTSKEEHGGREIYNAGAELSTEVHRIFDIGGETVDKIRHGIKPELTYTYIPYIYQSDQPDFIETVSEQNSLTYSLTNTFMARLKGEDKSISYLEFFFIKLSQTYDIREGRKHRGSPTTEKRPFSNVDMELKFDPFQYLSFDADVSYDVNSGEWKKTNYDLTLSDWRGDSATVEYRYTQQTLEEINVFLKAKVTDSLDLTYVLRRDEMNNIYHEATYGLDYHKQCWSMAVTYSDDDDDRVWMVVFSLYGLGKVGKATARPERLRGGN